MTQRSNQGKVEAMKITPVEGKVFGAVVTEVELRGLDDERFEMLRSALAEHGFLVFPGQFLNEEENCEFGARFGPLEFGAMQMANLEKQGDGSLSDVFDVDSQRMRTNVGNEAWHTDSTYHPISSKCAMLAAVVVPAEGGETDLADARAGYAALDEKTRARIEGLSAYHSTQFSQANDLGDFPAVEENSIYHGEAYLRPLVKVHPETGVKNLFIGRHAFGIPGLSRIESRELLRSLLDVVVSDESRVYRHRWQPGDLLVWDNRALLHRAVPYDYRQPRFLIATRIQGDTETELAYYPTDPRAQAGRDALSAELELLRQEATDRRYGATAARS